MPILTFRGFPHSASYRGSMPGTSESWHEGEAREVSAETADYLVGTFGVVFARSDMPSPPRHSMIDLSILDGSVGALRKALESGSLDASLDALLDAEEAGKTRKGAVTAIKARQASAGA